MANSEYSRLRSIARKRIERLSAAGFAPAVKIPTVKEIKASGASMERATESLRAFLSSGQTVKQARVAESTGTGFKFEFNRADFQKPKRVRTEAEKQRRRERDRLNRMRRKGYSMMGSGKYKEDYPLRYVQGLEQIQKNIPPRLLPAFYDYMEERFAQGVNIERLYRFITFTEDFQELMNKEKTIDIKEVMKDFYEFVGDQDALRMKAKDLKDRMSASEVDELWRKFLDKRKNRRR